MAELTVQVSNNDDAPHWAKVTVGNASVVKWSLLDDDDNLYSRDKTAGTFYALETKAGLMLTVEGTEKPLVSATHGTVEADPEQPGKYWLHSDEDGVLELTIGAGVEVEVQPNPGAPAVTVPAAVQELLKGAALTEEEKAMAAAGAEIVITLEVKDASATVPAADKAATESAMRAISGGTYKLGQYLDISLFKTINGGAPVAVNTTDNTLITLTIAVPKGLQASGRTFKVVRVHNGVTAVLDDLDSSADTITIQTNLFSSYAIVYADGAAATATPTATPTASAAATSPKTGDETPLALWTVLLALSCVGLGLAVTRLTKRRRSGR